MGHLSNPYLTFAIIISTVLYATCQTIDVQSPAGNIKGRVVDQNGKKFGVFLGIPFAKPPIGNLRFKPPVPLDAASQNQTIDATATEYKRSCVQSIYSADKQSEDCLYLNVLSPRVDGSDNKIYPVMVYIYGGGWIIGSASDYPYQGILKNLVSRDVVYVSMNYRLGQFGFYTTKSSVAPGNYGFLDQTEALKWVQKNIQSFGGDPSKVTIFGQSAGGVSVSLQTVTPLSKGLFQQAIIMSGSGFAHWAKMTDDDSDDRSGQISEAVGCRPKSNASSNAPCPQTNYIRFVDESTFKLHQKELECMQTKSVEELVKQDAGKGMGWASRVDGVFLPEPVEELMKKRNPYNLMVGVTKDEFSSLLLTAFLGDAPPPIADSERIFYRSPVGTSHLYISCKSFAQPGVVNVTARFHYGRKAVPNNETDERHAWFQQDVNLKSSQWFWVPAYQDMISAVQTNSKVYAYSFDWKDALEMDNMKKDFYYKGAAHGGELYPLFGGELFGGMTSSSSVEKKRDSSQDANAENTIGTLWTNFAKFGNPTPNGAVNGAVWEQFNPKDSNYLSLDFPNVSMKKDFYKEDVELWTDLIPKLEKSVVCVNSTI